MTSKSNSFDGLWEPEPNTGCYLWVGYINSSGRPMYGSPAKLVARILCQQKYGSPLSSKHQAAHKCHNKMCVNPDHIVWATQSENIMMGDPAKRKEYSKNAAEKAAKLRAEKATYITRSNQGYVVKIKRKYIGYTRTIEEAINMRDKYLAG